MTNRNNKIKEISDELNEHIIAVKGTLELLDTSVSDDELHNLLLKALERVDSIHRLSNEIFVVLKQILEKMDEMKTPGEDEEEKRENR